MMRRGRGGTTMAARGALAALLACAFVVCAQAKEWKDIRFATEGARPPYNYLDAANEPMGFEIDLGRELCARIKATCTFVTQDWDSLFPALLEGRVDALMAALEITEQRLQTIDFTKPYVRMPNTFVVARDSDIARTEPEDLKDRAIGVEADGPHASYLESRYAASQIRTYANLEEAILDLAEGRVDAVFGEKEAIMDFMKNRREAKCCRALADVARDPAFFGEGIGIGVRQSDRDLKDLLDKALAETIADGAFARIRAKYFDYEVR